MYVWLSERESERESDSDCSRSRRVLAIGIEGKFSSEVSVQVTV